MTPLIKFAAIGECMIELAHQDAHTLKMNFAGDTLNMATYFVRAADQKKIVLEYITALGVDAYSQQMIANWKEEGIGVNFVRKFPDKLPGLYIIKTDEKGERSFYFYRSQSAARQVFKGNEGADLCNQLLQFNYIYFSGIAIAILDDEQRELLLNTLRKARQQGSIICFDSNYRASLWPTQKDAATVMQQFYQVVDIALPSYEDETILFGDKEHLQIAKRLQAYGVKEIVIKQGDQGYFLSGDNVEGFVKITAQNNVVDTTGAGDSFNGTYLAHRLGGATITDAARKAAAVAAVVIQHRGAIIPK